MQGGVFNVADGGSESRTMSSEDSSCTDDQSELELGLELSLGGGSNFKMHQASKDAQFARILIAKDFPSLVPSAASPSASSSSSSSPSLCGDNVAAKIKRPADSMAAANGFSQVVGWPPIGVRRMNSMVNQAKAPAVEGFNSTMENRKNGISMVEKSIVGSCGNAKLRQSLFVKVNMDGTPIGRKVDLNAHESYEKLAKTLEDMFLESTPGVRQVGKNELTRLTALEHGTTNKLTRTSELPDVSSDFALTYEDKEGDWMLVGDVPWEMFVSSVKRLRIVRTSEATGLGM